MDDFDAAVAILARAGSAEQREDARRLKERRNGNGEIPHSAPHPDAPSAENAARFAAVARRASDGQRQHDSRTPLDRHLERHWHEMDETLVQLQAFAARCRYIRDIDRLWRHANADAPGLADALADLRHETEKEIARYLPLARRADALHDELLLLSSSRQQEQAAERARIYEITAARSAAARENEVRTRKLREKAALKAAEPPVRRRRHGRPA